MAIWQDAEKAFEEYYAGKEFNLYRFEDYGDVNYRSGRNTRLAGKVGVSERPSDYLLTANGQTYYVEVKSCSNETSFPFKNVSGSQWRAAKKQVAAKGRYDFVIYSVHHNKWYQVPAEVLLEAREQDKKSLAYKLIEQYHWPDMDQFFSTFGH